MRYQRGFTLIELMIVMVVVAILAAVGYPAYRSQVEKGHLSEGRAALTEAASQLERCYSRTGSYKNCDVKDKSENGTYDIQVKATSDTTYTATAKRVKAKDLNQCGNLTLTQTGKKGVSGGSKPADECW